MKKKSVIVMVPKKEKTEIYSKTKTLQEKPPKKLEIAETETENREKNDAETYITE
jgi:hypothetical protein